MKSVISTICVTGCGRSLHRERGLKYYACCGFSKDVPSLPSQGAWIEIVQNVANIYDFFCRSLHRERGLKFVMVDTGATCIRRSLHRERGLKWIEL